MVNVAISLLPKGILEAGEIPTPIEVKGRGVE